MRMPPTWEVGRLMKVYYVMSSQCPYLMYDGSRFLEYFRGMYNPYLSNCLVYALPLLLWRRQCMGERAGQIFEARFLNISESV